MWQNDYCGIEWVDSIPDFIIDAIIRILKNDTDNSNDNNVYRPFGNYA